MGYLTELGATRPFAVLYFMVMAYHVSEIEVVGYPLGNPCSVHMNNYHWHHKKHLAKIAWMFPKEVCTLQFAPRLSENKCTALKMSQYSVFLSRLLKWFVIVATWFIPVGKSVICVLFGVICSGLLWIFDCSPLSFFHSVLWFHWLVDRKGILCENLLQLFPRGFHFQYSEYSY